MITSKHPGEMLGISGELKVLAVLCLQGVKTKFEEYTVMGHLLFFLSFELESFLNKGCFH